MSKAEQLIACLEGEIASRDVEIERVTANCNALDDQNDQLRAELSAIKAQEPIGWYTEDHLDDKSATTYSWTVAERWVEKGWPVSPLYAAPAAPAADAWIPVSERLPAVESRLDQECRVGTLSIAPLNISAAVLVFDGEKVKSTRLEWFDGCLPLPYCITHWMPLPAAPAAHRAKGVV